MLATALGVAFGGVVPAGLELSFAVPLIFLALLAPAVTDRASVTAAAVAGLVALAGDGLPYELGLLAGALAGVVAALAVERGAER